MRNTHRYPGIQRFILLLISSSLLPGGLIYPVPTVAQVTVAASGPFYYPQFSNKYTSSPADSDSSNINQPDSTLKKETPLLDNQQPNSTVDSTSNSSAQDSSQNNVSNLTIDDIAVEGNRLISTEDILGVVKTKPGDLFDREKVLEDLKAINNLGYFDDRSLQVLPERSSSGGVLLKIRVQENAPVTQFSFQGNQVVSTEEIARAFSDQLGKPQNLNRLSAAIDKVEQVYHQKGYVLARITDVKDDPDGSISLTINEGTIAKIQVVGNHKTKDFIIRNAIKLKPGMIYNERALTGSLRKLYANGYFQDIRRSLAPSVDQPDKYVLKVEVDEKRTSSVGLGGGLDTTYGPFGSLTFSDSNFLGRGQVLSFSGQIGAGMYGNFANTINNGGTGFLPASKTYMIQADWIEPNLRGSNISMSVSNFAQNYNSFIVNYALQRTLGSTVTFNKPLGHNLTASLGFTGQNVSLSDAGQFFYQQDTLTYLTNRITQMGMASDPIQAQQMAAGIRNQQLKGGTFMSVNPTIAYDTRDNPMDPRHGSYARLTSSPSLGLGNASFTRLGASVSQFIPVAKESSLAFNMQGGSSLGSMPQFSQYMLGGWNGVRGYRMFSDLGTGSSMLMATAEYRFPLPFSKEGFMGKVRKNVKGHVFFDAGQVMGNNSINDIFQRSAFGMSTGLGVNINMPYLGMIRLDYGIPLVPSVLGKMIPRFTVGFGPKF